MIKNVLNVIKDIYYIKIDVLEIILINVLKYK